MVMFPAVQKRGIETALPEPVSVGDGLQAQAMLIEAVAQGEITLDEAKALSDLVERHRGALVASYDDAQTVLR